MSASLDRVRRALVLAVGAMALAVLMLVLGAIRADAAPAAPGVREFQQPDGTTIELTAWGDEYIGGYDTLDGYAVVRSGADQPFYYADRAADGSLAATDRVVGVDAPPAVDRGLRPSSRLTESVRSASGAVSASSAAAPAWAGDDTDVLFLVAAFADVGCTYTDADFQDVLAGPDATGPGNLEDYYAEISHGNLELDVTVEGGAAGCYSLSGNKQDYDTGPLDDDDLVDELVALADPDVDFDIYDNDSNGTVDALGVIYAGGGPHDGCDTDDGDEGGDGDNLWPHSGSTGGTATNEATVDPFIINSELTYAIADNVCDEPQSIGLFAHEFGHSLGLPDLYDTDGSSEGVGWWSTMGSQYRSSVVLADTPPHFDPWSKWIQGWIEPDDKTSDVGNGPIDQVEDAGYVIQMLANPGGPEQGGSGEYFLVENRQLVGFDAQLPGCGLVVWHIEESMTHNKNEGHTTASHRLVDVEEADGLDELDSEGDRGDTGDPYPGSTGNRAFRGSSYPTSNLYDGSPSGVTITDISDCATVMTANFGLPNADLSITKSDWPDPVVAGEQLTYTITVTNNGPGTASNVEVVDELPDGVSYATDTDSCVDDGGVLTCSLGQMLDGDSVSFDIVVDVASDAVVDDPDGSIAISNTATVSADQADGNLSDNEATTSTVVIDRADLQLTKLCKPDAGTEAHAGEEAFCRISVKNVGPSDARDVTIEEVLVSTLTFELTDMSPECTDTSNANGYDVTCDLGDLPAGATAAITVRFTTLEAGPINDTATVDAATTDPDETNNDGEGTVVFRRSADLAVTKASSPDPVAAGEEVTYVIEVTNDGPSTAQAVVVSDNLPGAVTIESVAGSDGGNCTSGVPGDSSRPTTCNFGDVPAGASRTMTIVATVDPGATGQIINDVVVGSDTHDPDTSNNSDTETTQVDVVADLWVTKVAEPDPVLAGEVLTYTLTVGNHGPSIAYDVMLEDVLPDGVSVADIEVLGGTADCAVIEAPPLSVRCDIGDLAAGDSLQIVVDVLVAADVPDGSNLGNVVTVETSSTDPDGTNNEAGTDSGVATEADLSIDKDVNFETGNASTTIIYTITVVNGGPSDAQDVSVLDQLPSVLTGGGKEKVVFVFATDGCTYDGTTPHTVTCDAGTLPAGESVSWDVHLQVKGSVGEITNVATVSSTTLDPNLDDNTVEKTVTVSGGSDRPGGPGGGRGKGGGGGNSG